MIKLPSLPRLRRVAPSMPGIADLPAEIRITLEKAELDPARLAQRRIAVTVGSRGIASLQPTIRTLCDWLKEKGAQPFVIPAMGSHGGATDEGQRQVLEDYGITEASMGVPVRSSMKTASIGSTPEGFKVHMDRLAHEADGVFVFNRIKPHTNFSGRIESGWLKIMTVGMGKENGAIVVHRGVKLQGYEPVIRSMGRVVLASGRIVGALGILENEDHEVAAVRAAAPDRLVAVEEEAQELAKRLYARLPFSRIGLLIVDELGKDISGAGMDCKVIGRHVAFDPALMPEINLIYVRDLTPASEGNGVGVGLADLMHEQLYRKLDLRKVYINAQTALDPVGARLPMHFSSDARAIEFAFGAMGSIDIERESIVWIRNTQMLQEMLVSPGILPELDPKAGYQEIPSPFPPLFGDDGNLNAPWNGSRTTA